MTDIVSGLPSPGALQSIAPHDLYVIPKGFVLGDVGQALVKAGHGLSFLGTRSAFTAVEVVLRGSESLARHTAAVVAFEPWRHVVPGPHKTHLQELVETFAAHREPFGGQAMDGPKIMGIVNVTPDSFSDGGDHAAPGEAIAHGLKLADEGADVLDVGGESTRPGAAPVAPEEEQRRVIPVVRALAEKGCVVSVDTRHASTMGAAIEAGASMINDVTALQGDSDSLAVVARAQVPVILMHMQGEPQTMQSKPTYQYAPVDVYQDLKARVDACIEAGLSRSQISVDPGIGFGKTDVHNLALIESLGMLHGLGCVVTFGASRKSFIGRLCNAPDPKDRVAGSIASALAGVTQGVQFLRVHDVAETKQAITVANSFLR